MSFLKRLLGGETAEPPTTEPPATAAELEEAERRYELEIAREEARRCRSCSKGS
jgi:hypothetical protein